MSNDLISRKELMKIFSETIDGRRMLEYDCNGFPIALTLSDIKKFIRQAPAAYDIDTVCKELKRLMYEESSCEGAIWIRKCIEIVRNGGKKQ